MEQVIVYSPGVVFLSACVSNDLTVEEAEEIVNQLHPTGIKSRWRLHKEPFVTGHPNPCPCDRFPELRKHYLFNC